MKLGELEVIIQAEPEGMPLEPFPIDDPDGKEVPEQVPAEPELEPAKK